MNLAYQWLTDTEILAHDALMDASGDPHVSVYLHTSRCTDFSSAFRSSQHLKAVFENRTYGFIESYLVRHAIQIGAMHICF